MNCDDLRSVAADVALDELIGAERAEAIEHLAVCDACRVVVAELAAVADSLLLLAPEVEPAAGFESRVLDRMGSSERAPRRRWAASVAAIAAALLAGVIVGAGLGDRDGAGPLPAAAELRTADGTLAGSVVLADGPDRMTCVFEDPRFAGGYTVELVLADGASRDAGAFTAGSSPWSWTVPLDVEAGEVREVRILSTDGVVRATASMGSG